MSTLIPNFGESINILTANWQNFIPTNPQLTETIQIVNYVLIATVITGFFIYYYIKITKISNNNGFY